MATEGSILGRDVFDELNMTYEHAYGDNSFKISIVSNAIPLLPKSSDPNPPKVLDVGCGTGVPVSEMLANAGLDVHGFDIAPEMVKLVQSRVKGTFTLSDMIEYQASEGSFAGVFIVFSHLMLKYADFHAACFKFAKALQPGGLLVIGQQPADKYVKDKADYDESGAWVEDYPAPFMGKLEPTLMLTVEGQRRFLTSMGLEIVRETVDTFQPKNPKCEPEEQQYIIAKRPDAAPLKAPLPLP
ncbi:hypothetical protein H2203_003556 [Taxawa tesnikishii (nom. ined.)]|nr:hypothetical protein H2203_003556 [Dothideales sp. JES 119]